MNKINVIVSAGLSDYKLKTKITGLINNEHIGSIILVRKYPLNNVNKIANITPPLFIKNISILFEIWRIVTLIKVCRTNNIHAVIGIQLIAHGISSVIAGKLTNTFCIACPIGKDIHSYLNNSLYSPLLNFCVRNADMFAIMGPKSKEILLKHKISTNKLVGLNNYHDPSLFKIIDNDESYKWDFIYLGQLIKRKNLDLLIRAFHVAKATHQNIKLAIVGDGPERKKLEKLRDSLGLSNNVVFLGHTKNINKCLSESRVFVLVSEIEALPAAAIEAMHCGIPSLLTNICDIPGIFKDKYNALLIPPNNLDALVTAIKILVQNQELYKTLKNGCIESRREYQEKWSLEKQIHAWNKLLKLQNTIN